MPDTRLALTSGAPTYARRLSPARARLDEAIGKTDLVVPGVKPSSAVSSKAIVTLRDRRSDSRLAGVASACRVYLIEKGLIVGSNNLPSFEGLPGARRY